MSYLAALRLHFAGKFQTAPSTVNNDPGHYDVEHFKPEYRLPQTSTRANGWWNPGGNADWRLIGCAITAGSYSDGSVAGAADPALGMLVADADRQVAAKLVDLDPDQQMVSMIFGLRVRICDKQDASLVRGRFEPVAFSDVWPRGMHAVPGDDFAMSAAYQSVLTDLQWGNVSGSRLLTELRDAASDGLLSIRFTLDGYNMSPGTPDFTLGRIVGTIGVASASEPRHFVPGRQFARGGRINYCTAVVDEARGRVIVDLANALPTNHPGGPPEPLGTLRLGYLAADGSAVALGTIDYLAAGWYEERAGVSEVAVDAAQLAAIARAPLWLRPGALARAEEFPGGLYARADSFVYRLDPGDSEDVPVFATRWGKPFAGAQITTEEDPSQLQNDPANDTTRALSFPAALERTDAAGRTTLTINASDPGNPRRFIDGQVYGVRPAIAGEAPDVAPNPANHVSVLIFDVFKPHDPITWTQDLQQIFKQYANLYPVMAHFLDMGSYESVCANRELLRLAFGLDPDNPNSMPVTRDLSRAKRTAILNWLDAPGPDGKPLVGPAAATPGAAPEPQPDGLELAETPRPGAPAAAGPPAARGGKSAAMARRRGVLAAAAAGEEAP